MYLGSLLDYPAFFLPRNAVVKIGYGIDQERCERGDRHITSENMTTAGCVSSVVVHEIKDGVVGVAAHASTKGVWHVLKLARETELDRGSDRNNKPEVLEL